MSMFDPSNVDVEHFLDTLGVDNLTKATSHEMRFSCPFPNHGGGDETPSAFMNIESAKFFCHGCKEKGSAVELAEYVLGISPLEARRILKAAYQPGAINPDMMEMVREVEKIQAAKPSGIVQPVLSEDILDDYDMDWHAAHQAWKDGHGFQPADYFFERGFDPSVLTYWQFGWDPVSHRVVLPVRDLGGRLIGFKARATDGRKPKYLVLGDKEGDGSRYGYPRYFPSHVVFGAHRHKEGAPGPLVVCEGEFNAIVVNELDIASVAINGSYFNEFHARVIRSIASDAGIIVYLDEDPAGLQCIWGWENARGEYHPGIVDLLSPHLPVRICRGHEKDAADSTREEILSLIQAAPTSLQYQLREMI